MRLPCRAAYIQVKRCDHCHRYQDQCGINKVLRGSNFFFLLFYIQAGFIARISAIKAQFDAQRAQRPSGGSFYNTYKTRTSGRFARAIIASTLEGRTSYREGLKLLGLAKYETFQKVAREFNFQV